MPRKTGNKMNIDTSVTLNNGVNMPIFGLGVWKASEEDTLKAVSFALENNYRHIDTAWIYGNEAAVGKAVRDSGIDRSNIFITTKLWRDHHDNATAAIADSLKRLQMTYVDLYLSHFPAKDTRIKAYLEMEKMLENGLTRAIGVSNYTVKHLEDLLEKTSIIPAVNQVELHVFLQQPDLVEYCRDKNIQMEAYSPLAHAVRLNDKSLMEIAKKYNKSVAQLMIRWCLEQGFITIPKSINPSRILENSSVFDVEISEEDLAAMRKMNEGLRTCWDPTDAP